MNARTIVLGALALTFFTACEAVIGADFSQTDECDPTKTGKCPKGSSCAWVVNRFACSTPPDNPTTPYGSCESASCPEGWGCSEVARNTFVCLPYCRGACNGPASCTGFKQPRVLSSGQEIGTCDPLSPPCDPTASTSICGDGLRCRIFGSELTACIPQRNAGGQGAACELANDCTPGFVCLNTNTCAQFCFTNKTTPGCKCTSFDVTFMGQTLGYCQ